MKKEQSKEYQKYLNRQKGVTIGITAIQIGILILFVVLWQVLTDVKVMDSFIVSSPKKMYEVLVTLISGGELWHHVWTTLYETILSFLLSTIIGTIVAIVLWFSATLRRVIEPYLVVLNALPKIALGPIIIIWVGAGTKAIVVMGVLISVIITIINTLTGFINVDKEKLLLMKTLNANKFQTLTKLVLPANIPTIMACLKINVGLSWVGTIMGEYISSKAGLGYLIIYGGQVFNLSLVMCSTVILCLLAAVMYAIVALLEHLVKRKLG